MDVFISWTRDDEDVKNALVERLQAENITYADSDEFCMEDYSTECIEAIDRCKVFIVIVSDASMQGGYVLNEVIHARKLEDQGKLNFLVYKVTDSPYTAAFNFQMNHISAVFGNLIRGGANGMDTIVKRTKTLLENRKNGKPEKPFDASLPEVDGMQIVSPGYFVEHSRDDALAAISRGFKTSNIVVLKELFGYGKRSTVKKYAHLHQLDYDTQVIVQNDNATLREFFLAELQFSNVNPKVFEELEGDKRIREKLRFLKKLDKRHLLVISDVRFETVANTWLFEALKNLDMHIIITTQESAVQFRDWFPVVDLGRMEDPYLKELFFHHYDYAYEEEKQALDAPLTQYFSEIGGHTKTVELTASVLSQEWGVHPEEVPEYLKLKGCEGMQLKDLIFNQLNYLLDVDKLSQEERTVLLVAAYIAVPCVSEKKFRGVLENLGITNWQCVIGLDKRRWLDIDMRNRTVSMEPLIAQIVLGKIPDDEYDVALSCFTYWMETAVGGLFITVDNQVYVRELEKITKILELTDMEEAAGVLRLVRQYSMDAASVDPAWMKSAIGRYQEKYPTRPSQASTSLGEDRARIYRMTIRQKDIFSIVEEDTSEEDILDSMLEEYEQEYPQACERLKYELSVMFHMTNSFLPLAKSVAAEISLFDWVDDKQLLQKEADILSIDLTEIAGASHEDVQRTLMQMRSAMEADEDFDENDGVYLICIEMLAAMDALYRRDLLSMMESLQSSLRGIFLLSEDAQEDVAQMLYTVAYIAAIIFISIGAYHSAVLLCEEILALESRIPARGILLKTYISALQNSNQYGRALFNAYEECLQLFAGASGNFIDGRQETLAEEKQWRLSYAKALARGDRLEDAEKMFAQAEAKGVYLKAADSLETAELIADQWLCSGEFERAVRFTERYLQNIKVEMLYLAGVSRENPALENLRALRDIYRSTGSNDGQEQDPLRYIDYYSQFSRDSGKASGKYYVVADKAMKFDFSHLSDAQIMEHAQELKRRSQRCKPLDLAPEAFALASEAGMRTLGYKHHYVQYVGAAVMADGKVAEILNGEGKTYTVVAVAFLRYLYGDKVLVVDSSPYLTERNFNWMRPVYQLLGMTCHHIVLETDIFRRRDEDQSDVCYVALRHLIFGYLHSETELEFRRAYMRYDWAIIDEIDSVLVDEAEDQFRVVKNDKQEISLEAYGQAWDLAWRVEEGVWYTYKNGTVTLNRPLVDKIQEVFGVSYSDLRATAKIKELENMVRTAILCRHHYRLGEHYHIHEGLVVRENKRKGLFEPLDAAHTYFLSRENSLPLAPAIRALSQHTSVTNMITVRDLFKKFKTICGTTATAVSFRQEFKEIYNLDYVAVPPEKKCIRKDYKMPMFATMPEKERAIVELVFEKNMRHQPVLLICHDVQESERYAYLLRWAGIPHQVLNARNPADASDILSRAGEWDSVLIATFLANRGADIKLGGDAQLRARREMLATGADMSQLQAILRKNRQIVAEEKKKVIAAGGLCVIGTSFFADGRTEQQTRGRSGRQGDVGESYVFWSLEDESMKRLMKPGAVEKLQRQMASLGVTEADNRMIQRVYLNSQRKLHDHTFSQIRSANSASTYLDESRPEIIGRAWDLAEGKLTVEDLCHQWARHPKTHAKLDAFQKGEPTNHFFHFRPYRDRLSKIRGKKAEQVLFEILYHELLDWDALPMRKQRMLIMVAQLSYYSAWGTYIQDVLGLTEKERLTKKSASKQLSQIKEELLYNTLHSLLQSLIGKK